MSCQTCGSAGSCGCSSVIIPIGPPGVAGPTGLIGPIGIQGPIGLTGIQGVPGVTMNKYAVTMACIANTSYTIAVNTMTNSGTNPLLNTWASTPNVIDFIPAIWVEIGGGSNIWALVTSNPTYIPGIGFQGNQMIFTPQVSANYRIILLG